MKLTLFAMLFGFSLVMYAQSASEKEYLNSIRKELLKEWPENRTINFVFHGHSVPTGYGQTPCVKTLSAYPHLVLHGIKECYANAVVNVITTSIGGEQSEQGAKRFKNEVLCHKPDILFIDYALNDRGIGLQRSETAWRQMIEEALAYGCKIILLTPTPDTSENILHADTPLMQYTLMIQKLAEEYHLGLVDSYGAFKQMAEKGENMNVYMSQSNHPNEKGHQMVANLILKYINE